MFEVFDSERSPVIDFMYGGIRADYSPLVERFDEFPTNKLDIGGREYTLYTKPAFTEFEDGRVEEGFAYLFLGQVGDFTSITEICFARVTFVSELYKLLINARDCEDFIHFFGGRFYGGAVKTDKFISDDDEEVITHLGSKRGISFGSAFVTEEAVFIYGDDLFDGWLCPAGWHVFKGSEWIIREDLGFTGVCRNSAKKGEELPDGAVMIEEFDSNCELHQIAKSLPFDKEEVFDDYTLEPDETGRHVRRHPRTLLLPEAV